MSSISKYKEDFDAILKIANASDTGEAWSVVERHCRDLGYDYAGIGIIGMQPEGLIVEVEHATPFFQRSFSEYQKRELHLSDPSADAMARGAKASFTLDACQSAQGRWAEGAEQVLSHLRKDNISGHYASRIDTADARNFGFLCVGRTGDSDQARFRQRVLADEQFFQLAGMAFASVTLRSSKLNVDNALLTKRERRILTLYAEGLTVKEIAESERKTPATITSQLVSARRRLGARNTVHCVSIALSMGLIKSIT